MNRIDKIELDFRIDDVRFARSLYGRWENFYTLYIERELESVFRNPLFLSSEIRIDRLDLDLGIIPAEKLDEYFPLLIREKLEEALCSFLQNPFKERTKQEEVKVYLFEVLCRFLLHGVFPWNIENKYRNFDFLFLVVLKENAGKLKLFLLTYGHYTGLRQRLVNHLKDPELEAGIRLIAPGESHFICSYIRLIQLKYKDLEQPLIRESDYRRITWQVVYTYLLNQRSSWFNRKSFLQSTLSAMASSYNLTYEYLLTVITNRSDQWQYRHHMPAGLILLLYQLKEEFEERQWQITERVEKKLQIWLLQTPEDIPVGKWSDRTYKNLVKILSGGDSCRRFLTSLPEEAIYRLVQLILPGESVFVIEYACALEQQKEEGVLAGKAGSELRLLKWLIIFPVLLEKYAGSFNRKYFVNQVISRIAAHYNLTVQEVLTYICKEIDRWKYTSPLQDVFWLLWQEYCEQGDFADTEKKERYSWKQIVRRIRQKQDFNMKERTALFKWIEQSGGQQGWIKDLKEKEHKYLIQVLLPGESSFVISYATSLEYQRIKGVLQGKAGSEFRQVKWEFIYTVLTAIRQHVFNKVYFVETTLFRISRHYNVTLQELLCYFYEDRNIRTVLPFELIQVLDELHKRYVVLSIEGKEKKKAEKIFRDYFTLSGLSLQEKKDLFRNPYFWQEAVPVLEIERQLYQFMKNRLNLSPDDRVRMKHWLELIQRYKTMTQLEWLDSILKKLFSGLSICSKELVMRELKRMSRTNSLLEQYTRKYITPSVELPFQIADYSYIGNAGLALLGPFLTALFTKAGLVSRGQFASVEHQFRAIHLLQYAVYGDGIPYGESLLLNYLLTGTDPSLPLPEQTEISEQEKELTQSLLKSLLQHWGKLKGTSVDGLREAFLQRSGKLEEKSDLFYLYPDEKAYDILLDTIPWNFHTIKLAWMQKPIYVKWR